MISLINYKCADNQQYKLWLGCIASNQYHSTTLETWTAQVGKERALEGSLNWKEDPIVAAGNSAAQHCPTKVVKAKAAAPNRAPLHFCPWTILQRTVLENSVLLAENTWNFGVVIRLCFDLPVRSGLKGERTATAAAAIKFSWKLTGTRFSWWTKKMRRLASVLSITKAWFFVFPP